MHAVIPVAGFGSRLRPHTHTVPKVLLSVAGKPIIGHIIDRLIEAGVTSMTIVIGYLGDQIKTYVSKEFPTVRVDYIVQEELLGLGHSIWVARNSIPTDGSPLFIILGDTIFGLDLRDFFAIETNAVGAKEVEDPRRFGVIELGDDGMVERLVEKPEHPKSNLAIVGLYLIRNPKLLLESLNELVTNNLRTRNEFQLTDALQKMMDRGEKFAAFPIEAWYDCGKPETLLSTNRHLLDEAGAQNLSIEGSILRQPFSIAKSATITNCIIGPHVSIGENAVIKNSIIENSIVSDNTLVSSMIISESILGESAIAIGKSDVLNLGASSSYGQQPE